MMAAASAPMPSAGAPDEARAHAAAPALDASALDASAPDALLTVRNLRKHFVISPGGWGRGPRQVLKAVDDVSFWVARGETLGLVGESGCGKTTTGRLILRLLEPTSGSVHLGGPVGNAGAPDHPGSPDLMSLSPRQMLPYRRRMQMIFQDPYSSLNPRMTIGSIIGEALTIHNLARGRRDGRIAELLEDVGLPPAVSRAYPHELSGGQRQRVGIARALAVEPELIIADEPVSALDVSIQAQIINLLHELRQRHGLSFLFIAHDLSVVGHMSHRVAVMYLGRIVEIGPRAQIFDQPLHPYTQALLEAAPRLRPKSKGQKPAGARMLEGDVPSPVNPPSGCPFHTRCPQVMPHCSELVPPLREHRPGQQAACHLYEPPPSS